MTKFVEKPKVQDISPGFDLASAAVFILERELLGSTTFQNANNFSFDILEPAVAQDLPIYACDIYPGFRYDAGRIDRWHELNMKVIRKEIHVEIPAKEIRPSIWIGEQAHASKARFEPPLLIGDAVRVEGEAALGPDVIIGNGCVIGEGAAIHRSLIMDDCRIGAGAKLDHCLIGPHCRICEGTTLSKRTVVGDQTWPNWSE